MISAERRAAWRKTENKAMISALNEYCPDEFWELLDAYEALLAKQELFAAGHREA